MEKKLEHYMRAMYWQNKAMLEQDERSKKDWMRRSEEAYSTALLQPDMGSPTTVNNLVAAQELMTAPTLPSSPLGQQGMTSGLVGQSSKCAHELTRTLTPDLFPEDLNFSWWCMTCGVLKWYGKMLVPAAATSTSISVKQDSGTSAGTPAGDLTALSSKFCLAMTIQDESKTNLCTLPKGHGESWYDPYTQKHHNLHEHDLNVAGRWGIP